MKIVYTPEEIEMIKNINALMDVRISQLKEVFKANWWSASLEDPYYKKLCQCLASIKANKYNTQAEVSKEELDRFIGMATIDEKTSKKIISKITHA